MARVNNTDELVKAGKNDTPAVVINSQDCRSAQIYQDE